MRKLVAAFSLFTLPAFAQEVIRYNPPGVDPKDLPPSLALIQPAGRPGEIGGPTFTRTNKGMTVRFDLDGEGRASVRTGVGFMDHMLTLFAVHGLFDLEIAFRGDGR